MKVDTAIKAATHAYCRIMAEEGRGCDEGCPCWMNSHGCEETRAIAEAIRSAAEKEEGEGGDA